MPVAWEGEVLALALAGGEVLVLAEDARTLARWRVDRERIVTLDLSADGSRLLTLDAAGELELWDAPTGERLGRWRPARGEDWPLAALAPDGERALVGQPDGLWLRPLDGAAPVRLEAADPAGPAGFFGPWIWGADTLGQLRLWHGADGRAGPALEGLPARWVASATGDVLAVSDRQGTVWVVGVDGRLSAPQRAPGFEDQRFALGPEGRRFTYVADGPGQGPALVTVGLRTATPLAAVPEPGGVVQSLVWSPEGRFLAVCTDQALRLLPAPRLSAPPGLPFGALPALMVGFDAEAEHALAVFGNGEVWLWNPDTGQDEHHFALPLAADRGDRAIVDLHPDGSRLAWADPHGVVRVRDLATGQDQTLCEVQDDPLIRWGSDGSLVVAEPGRLRTWNHDGAPVLDLALARPARVAVGEDGARVAVADASGQLRVLRGAGGEELTRWVGRCPVETLRFRRGGDLLVVESCGPVHRLTAEGAAAQLGDLGPLNRAALDHRGELLLVLHGAERMGRLDLSTWQDLGPVGEPWPEPLGLRLERVAVHPDGRRALTAGELGQVQLWDLEAGVLLRTLTGHRPGGFALALDPKGGVVHSTHAGGVLLRVTLGGGAALEQRPLGGEVFALATSPDGRLLALGDGAGRVRLVRAEDGSLVAEAQPFAGAVVDLAFSADGWRLAARAEDGALVVLAREGRALREETRAPQPVRGQSWSPGGATLLAVLEDGALWTWDGQAWWPRRTPRRVTLTGPIAWCAEGLVLGVSNPRDPTQSALSLRTLEGRGRPVYAPSPATQVACGGGLVALAGADTRVFVSTREGAPRLLTRTDGTPITDLEVLADGRVFALTLLGHVYAWDPLSSALLWRAGPEDEQGEPLPVQVIPRVPVMEELLEELLEVPGAVQEEEL